MNETFNHAWAAGFIDGEGYIGHRKLSRNGISWEYVAIRVTQTMEEPLERLKMLYGGTIHQRKHRSDRKPIWEWSLLGQKEVANAIKLLLPYSVVKRDKMADGLIYLNEKLSNPK